MKLSFMSRHM